MSSLVRWDPFGEVRGLHRHMEHLFDDFFRGPRIVAWEPAELGFALDVYEKDDAVVVKGALPGVRPEEVDISVTGDILTIKGETKSEEETKDGSYHRRELRYGAFARSIALPTRVDHDKAEATFENGILTISLPKAEEVKPKSIKIAAHGVIEGKS
jgi:HSP20 family protein